MEQNKTKNLYDDGNIPQSDLTYNSAAYKEQNRRKKQDDCGCGRGDDCGCVEPTPDSNRSSRDDQNRR